MPPGKPLAIKRDVTVSEHEFLAQFGWKPGDPIPLDFARAAQEAARDDLEKSGDAPSLEVQEQIAAWVDSDQQAIRDSLARLTKPPSVEGMSAATRATLTAKLAEAKHLSEVAGIETENTGNYDESVLRAMRALAVDAPAAIAPEARPDAEAPTASPPEDLPGPEAGDDDGGSPEESEATADLETGVGSASVKDMAFCPHCQWELNLPVEEEIPLAEKQLYVECCALGARFTREYPLFNGRVAIVFQEMTLEEAQAVATAAAAEAPPLVDNFEYATVLLNHMMAMSVVEVIDAKGPRRSPPPTNGAPDAKARLAWARRDLAPRESFWRVLVNEFRAFRRLLVRLEAGASSPNFYKATLGPS